MSSNSIIVSYGTSFSSFISCVPSKTPSPTLIRASTGFLVTSSFVCFSSTTESLIVKVTFFDPFSPSLITFISPFLRFRSFSTLVSNGITSVYSWVPSVPEPRNWTLAFLVVSLPSAPW